MESAELHRKAGAVAGIYNTIATIVVVLGVIGVVAAFIQSIAAADTILGGIFAGVLISAAIAVYVIVAWAGVQLFAIVAGYIQSRTSGNA